MFMKDVELKLASELMKNSRRSDRELAKAVGVSQPTISRLINKLEKDGVIKEYTMIPDFSKLGYELLAITFIRHRSLTAEELDAITKMGMKRAKQVTLSEAIIAERGMGLGYDAVIVSYEKDYSTYLQHIKKLKQFPHLDSSNIQSFLINLNDEVHYRYLTFSTLARHLLSLKEKKEK